MNKLIFTFLASVFIAMQAIAQGNGADENVLKESKVMMGNFDSLVHLWYMKNTIKNRNSSYVNTFGFKPDDVPQYSDSVYAKRIASLSSPFPYTYNAQVKAFIDLYLVRRRDLSEKILGLSEYYFPMYEEILAANDMPQELKFLSVVESALIPQAVSPAAAVGPWQFMYSTGRMYGMTINSYVDERRDPQKSTLAAAQYVKDLYNAFGDWFLALAAYNCGPGNVNKAIRRSGGKKTFWEIYNYLPAETRGYVPAFIAVTYLFQYHKEHNLYPQSVNLPTLVDTILVNQDLDFSTISMVTGAPMELIRYLNPHYIKDKIPARSNNYILKLPVKYTSIFAQYQDSIYRYQASTYIKHTPETTRVATPTYVAPPPKIGGLYYTVKSGDNLPSIADWFDVSVYNLMRWNNMRNYKLLIGKRLAVYVPMEKYNYYLKINNMTLAQKIRISDSYVAPAQVENKTTIAKTPQQENKIQTQEKAPQIKVYVVQKGDTLWSIAQKYPGVSIEEIKQWNNLKGGRSIWVGQKIKIQSKG